ncbi:hypothetical protein ACQPZF_16910 [Actinosynnema sp. CS-041913]|uniref:hypothetical protein n=1 Tax=Actinosynnema sp. CS-041913 TaxID=3239917 RepID=UPI003D8C58CE
MAMSAAISLRYVPDDASPYGNPERQMDLATAPVYQLFFSCFMGDVDLVIAGADFRTSFGWVSTLGFGIGLLRSIRKLASEEVVRVGFTESEDWIEFRVQDLLVTTSCSYSTAIAAVSYDQLLEVAKGALGELLDELKPRYPALNRNPYLIDALSLVQG